MSNQQENDVLIGRLLIAIGLMTLFATEYAHSNPDLGVFAVLREYLGSHVDALYELAIKVDLAYVVAGLILVIGARSTD